MQADHGTLGARYLYTEGDGELLFTENETNQERLFGQPNPTPYVKDGIHEAVVHGRSDAVNPAQTGTKCAAHYTLVIPPGETALVRLRVSDAAPDALSRAYPGGSPFGAHFDQVVETRLQEADAFYKEITSGDLAADAASVMRQALAGMLWTKQFYNYDVAQWLQEHGATHLAGLQKMPLRNKQWYHMVNQDVISMPDKWEYP